MRVSANKTLVITGTLCKIVVISVWVLTDNSK